MSTTTLSILPLLCSSSAVPAVGAAGHFDRKAERFDQHFDLRQGQLNHVIDRRIERADANGNETLVGQLERIDQRTVAALNRGEDAPGNAETAARKLASPAAP